MSDFELLSRSLAAQAFAGVGLVFLVASLTWAVVGWSRHRGLPTPVGLPLVPWRAGLVGLVIVTTIMVHALVLAAYVALARGGEAEPSAKIVDVLTARELIGVGLAGSVLVIPLIAWLLWRVSGSSLAHLGLARDPSPARGLLRGFLGCWLVVPVVYGVYWTSLKVFTQNTHAMERMLRIDRSVTTALLGFAAAVVVAPIVEEMIFRGALMSWLGRLFAGIAVEDVQTGPDKPLQRLPADWQPVVATALLWAVIHADAWPAPIPLFFLGIALGWAFQQTGSLFAPIGMHATFNGISTIWVLIAKMTAPDGAGPGG